MEVEGLFDVVVSTDYSFLDYSKPHPLDLLCRGCNCYLPIRPREVHDPAGVQKAPQRGTARRILKFGPPVVPCEWVGGRARTGP